MLAAKNMLNSLFEENTMKNKTLFTDYNDDYDFGKVLEFCNGDSVHKNIIRYSDGQEKTFSFNSKENGGNE